MSYILDALRKSEQERQRGTSPGLDTIHVPVRGGPERKRVWPWILAGVLTLNAAGILGWWLGPWQAKRESVPDTSVFSAAGPSSLTGQPSAAMENGSREKPATESSLRMQPSPSAGSTGKTASQAAESGPVQEPLTPPSIQGSRGPDRPLASAPRQTVASPGSPPGRVGQAKPPEPSKPERSTAAGATSTQPMPPVKNSEPLKADDPKRSALKPSPPAPPTGQAAARAPMATTQGGAAEMGLIEDLKPLISETRPARKEPEYSQVPASVKNDIPKLSLSFLVYSEKPAERRVTINGKVLREGDEISEGLKLEKITHEGAVFNYRGFHFHKGVF